MHIDDHPLNLGCYCIENWCVLRLLLICVAKPLANNHCLRD